MEGEKVMTLEEDRVRDIWAGKKRGDEAGAAFDWDPATQQLRVVDRTDPDGQHMRFTPEDANLYADNRSGQQ